MRNNRKTSMLIALILMMVLCAAAFTGCGGKESDTGDTGDSYTADSEAVNSDSADDGSDNSAESADSGSDSSDGGSGDWKDISDTPEIDIKSLGGAGGVDVDLTKLSSTMVYSVVNDMLIHPNAYTGKKVRMSGAMSAYYDEESGNTYYACIIQDATACCAQGIEFQTTDEYSPSDYPEEGEDLTVVGTYDLYEDNGFQYCVLKEASLEI